MFEISLNPGRDWAAPGARAKVPAANMPLFQDVPGLLAAFREGKPEALSTVYRHYVRSVDVYLRALARRAGTPDLCQPSAVADLLQEVFIRAFSPSARMAYDGLRDFGPYLNTIARNCFVDTLRKRRIEVPLGIEDLHVDEATNVGLDDYDPKVVEVLESYLERLSDPEKRVYEMRFVHGRSQEAACETLGVSRRSLRTAENRLRKGLRKALFMAGVLYETQSFSGGARPGGRS
jgi:RNA polymerase sigma-70 factor (ECF subfamily)